jgi:hypothetical protein
MYLSVVLLTMFLLPAGSILAQHFLMGEPYGMLLDTWFVFWSIGVRLVIAGCRQFFQPGFTAVEIFQMRGDEALPIIRELGIANFAVGLVAVLSVWRPQFRSPMVIVGVIFYGVAGVRHVFHKGKNRNEKIAMVSDLFVAAVLIASQFMEPA